MNSYTPTPRSPNVTPTGAEARERAAEFESSAPMTPTATTALDDRPSRDDVTYNSTMPSPGRRIGRYLVIEQIGAGGMGVVFSAYDDVLDRRVALKLVLDRRRGDATWYARTLREAQALARLSHPNVVQIYEAGEYADEIYLAMEFIKGCTLRELLKQRARARGGGPPRRDELPAILDLFQQAGYGLAAAHGSGLVHRDFKPANVLVDEAGRARVADFGLVAATATATTEATQGGDDTRQRHRADALGIELTREGAVMGTLAYMSPEQLSGQSADAQSDQFSFN
ncbi:MAG: serine/threonine protein kinase [Myxococcales bacterium]|nr:serine/threonine protein kinase [Myxococcales bacterium]